MWPLLALQHATSSLRRYTSDYPQWESLPRLDHLRIQSLQGESQFLKIARIKSATIVSFSCYMCIIRNYSFKHNVSWFLIYGQKFAKSFLDLSLLMFYLAFEIVSTLRLLLFLFRLLCTITIYIVNILTVFANYYDKLMVVS